MAKGLALVIGMGKPKKWEPEAEPEETDEEDGEEDMATAYASEAFDALKDEDKDGFVAALKKLIQC